MKLLILCLAILGVATAAAVPAPKVHSRTTRDLNDDLQDFVALVPVDQVLEIVIVYLAEDAEVQAAVEYIQSDEFKALVLAVESIPAYIRFLNWLQAAGLDVYRYINLLHELLGLPGLEAPTSRRASIRITGGLAGLITDLIAVLPVNELRALFYEKLETSVEFLALVTLLNSEAAQEIYDELKANEEYQWIKAELKKAGVDVDYILDLIRQLIGWGGSYSGLVKSTKVTKNLDDDFADFLALFPVDQILEIVIVYLAEDAEVQAAVEYIQSAEFKALVLAVEGIPEYIRFLNYLQKGGLDVYRYINLLHELLGLPGLEAPTSRRVSTRIIGGLKGLVEEIINTLPRDELRALFYKKLETSPEFAALINLLSSEEAQKVYDELKANEEYQWIKAELKKAGVDSDAILDVLRDLLGL